MFAIFCFEGPTPFLPVSCNHTSQSLDKDSLTGYKTLQRTAESLTSQTKATTLFAHCCPHDPVEGDIMTTACLSSEAGQRKHLLPSITPLLSKSSLVQPKHTDSHRDSPSASCRDVKCAEWGYWITTFSPHRETRHAGH